MSVSSAPLSRSIFAKDNTAPQGSHPCSKILGGPLTLLASDRPQAAGSAPKLLTSSPKDTKRVMQEIAREALRLSRETLKETTGDGLVVSGAKIGTSTPSKDVLTSYTPASSGARLNKFVRRLHDMLVSEKDSGVVEWRRGLLVLHSTDIFAKKILPQYFNTRNFKTFRRQLNYYGFVHVRSFSTTGTATTALWVNRELAQTASDDIGSVLLLRRVEPCESAKTTEGRRVRKELAIHTVEEDLGVSAKSLQKEQIRSMVERGCKNDTSFDSLPTEIHFPPGPISSVRVRSVSSVSAASNNTEAAKVVSDSSDEESAANLLLGLSRM